MKKLIIPAALALLIVGAGERKANAGSFSFGISIGDSHHYRPAPVVVAAPQIISGPVYAPAPVCAPAPVVVAQPQIVVAAPPCAPGYVVVRECERPAWYRSHHGPHGYYRPDYRRGCR